MSIKPPNDGHITPREQAWQALFNIKCLHLDGLLHSKAPAVGKVVNELCSAIDGLHGKRKMKISAYKGTRRFFNCLLVNFFDANFTGAAYHLAVKLGKDDYTGWDYKYSVVRNGVSGLEALGYVERLGFFYDPKTDTGLVTRFKATQKLIDLMANWDLTVIQVHQRKPLVEIHDIGKVERRRAKLSKTPRLYHWPRHGKLGFEHRRITKNLRTINAALAKQFQFPALPDDGPLEPKSHAEFSLRTALGSNKQPVRLRRIALHRIYTVDPKPVKRDSKKDKANPKKLRPAYEFNDGHGGRFYGPYWQRIKSDLRPYIRMAAPGQEPQETVEVDFDSLHPTMLYAACKYPVRGDLYDIYASKFKNNGLRDIIKLLTLTMINADSYSEAKNSFRETINTETYPKWVKKIFHQDIKISNAFESIDGKLAEMYQGCPTLDQLVEDIKAHHPRIIKDFCSGAGRWLMRYDSQMSEYIMLTMLREHGIVPLPNHDSFIVPVQYEAKLKRVMEAAFAAIFSGITPSTRTTRLDGKHHVLDESQLYSKVLKQWRTTDSMSANKAGTPSFF